MTNAPGGLETATWARRILALVVDWFACTFVVILVLGGLEAWSEDRASGFYVLGLFVLESAAFTALAGGRSASSPPGFASYASTVTRDHSPRGAHWAGRC